MIEKTKIQASTISEINHSKKTKIFLVLIVLILEPISTSETIQTLPESNSNQPFNFQNMDHSRLLLASCSQNCLLCRNDGVCIICENQNALIAGSCIECPVHCDFCSDGKTCDKCMSGYFNNGTSCLPCQSDCQICDDQSSCSLCSLTYFYDDSTQKCKTCLEGCNTCDDSKTCSSCKFFYELQDSQCRKMSLLMKSLKVIAIIAGLCILICCFCSCFDLCCRRRSKLAKIFIMSRRNYPSVYEGKYKELKIQQILDEDHPMYDQQYRGIRVSNLPVRNIAKAHFNLE